MRRTAIARGGATTVARVRLPARPWRLIPLAAAAGLAAGCGRFGAPDPASEQGESILTLWRGFFIAALFVGALVWGLLIYVLLRWRRRGDTGDGDELPSQNAYNIPLEIFYTAAPVVVVAVLFGVSWVTERDVNALTDDPAVRVEVVGFQWSWEFRYTDDDVVVTGEPGEPPELVLPVDQTTRLDLVSTDVAHSFWVPDFLSKRDLIPGVDNEIDITPTETGTFEGRCAEYCGLDHWRMYYSVRVVTQDDYDAWLADQQASSAGENDGEDDGDVDSTTSTTGVTETTDVPNENEGPA
jgi:cytochrome c oxidase subunit 2